ncbi:MAG: ribosome maturation factor RimM [Chitinophagaceae bacterium]|nr:ribosome maturation factor RimM [Rubrivivax sp.]
MQPAAASDSLPSDAVEVGRVIGAWGVKGAIKVKPFAADPQALFCSKRWYLKPNDLPRPPGARAGAAAVPPLLRVVQAREQGDGVVATVHDIADRDAAQALAGARVFVPRGSFPTPEAGEFYWVDLIGLPVANRQGLALGTVVGLLETGPHCVLRIAPDAGAVAAIEECLIPFVDAYVDSVDLQARRIVVDWDADDGA